MNRNEKVIKAPMPQEKIFRIMILITFVVASVFFLKNLFAGNFGVGIFIGVCLAIFGGSILIMKKLDTKVETQQIVVCISLLLVEFFISLVSGDYYSDDFCLYLASVGLAGLYLEPKYAQIQLVVIDILWVFQYFLHPEKAGDTKQFILCIILFNLAAVIFWMTIRRGRAFIYIGDMRAEEAEKLLDSMNQMGLELKKNFETSSGRVEHMQEANEQLEVNAKELRQGSSGIANGARDVAGTCEGVQDKMQIMEGQINDLNDEVKSCENALTENRQNMEAMSKQMQSVQETVSQTSHVFELLNEQMKEITNVTEQLNSISSNTTMLALNASIEAARAGNMGAGFAVVASNVQALAVDSTKCSGQVAQVVAQMQQQIKKTSEQLADSEKAIYASIEALQQLQGGFDHLDQSFVSLYENIEEQNTYISDVDETFVELKEKISQMHYYSEENQQAVGAIAEALGIYKDNVGLVIQDTRQIQQISAAMMELSKETEELE